ncbi:MAG: hypothetical protein HOY79_00360 [Streptomyces sp.]|nr:hypothetical protein [Streptomyces sp.]
MNLRPPFFMHRVLLIAAHAAQILVPLPEWPGDGQPTATFREDGTVRVPQWLACLRPPATVGDPA